MALVNLTTNLKSFRYGKDTVGGGKSNQPYVTRSIPNDLSDVGRTGGPDFLLRGGTLLPRAIGNDVSRLTQMLVDFRSPNGPLFIAKQNVLSLTNVNSSVGYKVYEDNTTTQAIDRSAIGNFLKDNIGINQGIYTPLSTIGQAAGNALGVHLNKQGLNPFTQTTEGSPDGNTPLGLPTYLNTIASFEPFGERKSRLEPFLSKINTSNPGANNLYSYSGGPGATLGVGKTIINMVGEYRTGVNNVKKAYWDSIITPKLFPRSDINVENILTNLNTKGVGPGEVPTNLFGLFTRSSISSPLFKAAFSKAAIDLDKDAFFSRFPSVYKAGTLLVSDTQKMRSGINEEIPRQTFTTTELNNENPTSKTGIFNKRSFTEVIAPSGSEQISAPLDYTQKNIGKRVNIGDPGRRGNLISYTIGKREAGSNTPNTVARNADYTRALDKINALPIYRSKNVTTDNIKNDLVKFRIGVIDNDNPNFKNYMHFRAFLTGMSDNFTANWSDQSYMGRGEKFYQYNGFDRAVNLSWTMAAQSKQELIPMYQKLNYLASVTTPDYSTSGYLRGNLISLTVGGYFQEQIGIMKGINIEVPEDSPWEIAIPDGLGGQVIGQGENQEILTDSSVKEMPKIINVTGFQFIPIHNFVPRVQQNKFAGGKSISGGGTFIDSYGKEHYIELASATGNNYDGQGQNINYIPKK